LVEKDDIFQVLIGVDALARIKIIMDFSDHTLYQKTDEIRKIGSFESVIEIEDEEDDIKDEFEEELNKDVLVDYLLTTEDKYIQILYEENNDNNDIDNSFGNNIENFSNKNFSNKNFNKRINNIFEKPNNKNNSIIRIVLIIKIVLLKILIIKIILIISLKI